MSEEDNKIHSANENLNFFAENTKNSNIPVEVNFGDENINFFHDAMPDNMPQPLEQPYGLVKNIWHAGIESNAIASVLEFGHRKLADLNPLDDYVDPNWKPDINELEGIDKRYIRYVMDASGPKDFFRRKNYVLDQIEENRKIDNGSLAGMIVGGLTIGAVDPTIFLPVAKAFRYASASKTFMEAVPKVLPTAALAGISHEAAIQTTKLSGNYEDFIINSFAETVLGTVFMSGVVALPTLVHAGKVFNAKNVIQMMNKGIEPRPVLNKKGIVVGWKATPMDHSVGAAEVDKAQAYLDGAMAKNSLYSIPYFGEKIGYAAGRAGQILGGWISPQVRMHNSEFSTVQGLIYHAADNGFETEGIRQGRAKVDTFEEDFNDIKALNKKLYSLYNGYYLNHNNIKFDSEVFGSQTRANVEAKSKSKTEKEWVQPENFGRKVQYRMISKVDTDDASVNNIAKIFSDTQLRIYKEWRELEGISEKIFPSRTAEAYATRSYNHPYLTTHVGEQTWLQNAPAELARYDKEIITLMQPIENAKLEYKILKKENAKKEELFNMRNQIKRLKENLQNALRSNHDLLLHIEDINAVSANEANQIIKLKAPIKKLEKEYIQFKKTAKSPEDKIKLRELKDKIDEAKLNLEDRMANKEIDDTLYYKIKDSNRYALKDEKNRLKLRKPYISDYERLQIATQQYDSIMNNTSVDLINNVLYSFFPSLNPNPTKPRSVMYRDKFLYDNNFLHPDPLISVMNYNLALGRKIAYKKMLNRLTVNGNAEELILKLKKEYDTKKARIPSEKKDSKKIEKRLRQLNRRYRVAQDDVRNTLDKIQGKTTGSIKLRKYTTMANLFAVSTKLGFLPMTMSTDLMANVFKHGFWPSVESGLIPMLKNAGALLNSPESKSIRANAAHALLSDSHFSLTYSDRNWMGAAQDYTPIQGKLNNALEKIAHFSLNFSGANYIQNLNEMLSALIIQSKIMNSLNRFLKDDLHLGEKDYKDLLKYGIDPKLYAKRFLDGWEEAGKSTVGFGSYLAKYWEWSDVDAANIMSKAIRRAVRDTIVKRGMFDAPFAMDDPLINSIFLFKGYVLSTFNRYLVPLLQKPDADKIMGTLLMMAVGATQNPLRRFIAGKDPMEESDHLLRNAIRDGGVFSIIGDAWQDLNFLTSNYFQDLVSNERYSGRTEMGIFNGPIGGIANDLTKVIGMGLSGELNQQDLKRLTTLIPVAHSWQFRALNQKMIENTEYPRTRYQAHKLKEAE